LNWVQVSLPNYLEKIETDLINSINERSQLSFYGEEMNTVALRALFVDYRNKTYSGSPPDDVKLYFNRKRISDLIGEGDVVLHDNVKMNMFQIARAINRRSNGTDKRILKNMFYCVFGVSVHDCVV
jgi:hypothetical protein